MKTSKAESEAPAVVLRVDRIASPIGRITFAVSRHGVCGLTIGDDVERFRASIAKKFADGASGAGVRLEEVALPALRRSFEHYFAGSIDALEEIGVDLRGTAFQQRVWAALRTIKPGTTASYGDIARRIGQPRAGRAVGMANNRNPVALIVPCHRVIGADGSMTGYGFGLETKRWLLRHEKAVAVRP